MKAPLVTVIIPTHNRSGFIGKAVKSVLEQGYENIEVVVVDDGSTDDTRAVLDTFGNAIRVIAQENRGVSAARNTGIAAGRGDLIAFLDSDDYWLPGKLSEQVSWFASHPDMAICQTEELWIRNGRRVNPGKRHRKVQGNIFIPSLDLCLISPSAVMLRKTLLDEVGTFDITLPACEDYDLWLRITCEHEVGLIERPLVVRQAGHPDQLSLLPALDKYRIASIRNIMESNWLTPEQQAAAKAKLEEKCRIFAQGCERRGKFEEAEWYRMVMYEF